MRTLSTPWRFAALGAFVSAIIVAAGMATMTASNSQTATVKTITQPGRIGIYGTRWSPWVRDNPRVFDFFIFQMAKRKNEEQLDQLASVTQQGVPVVVMQAVHESFRERFMRDGAKTDDSAVQVAQDIAEIYADPRTQGISTISLDEENLWWDGRAEYFTDIYRETKALLPQMNVWQWFNEHKRNRNAPLQTRYDVPADGYILDPYSVPLAKYPGRLRGYVRTGKPVLSLLWGSPDWYHGGRPKGRQFEWWDNEGWRDLYAQVRINRAAGVDTALFMYDLPYGEGAANRLQPLFKSPNPCAQQFMDRFARDTVPALRNAPLMDPTPLERPWWMPSRCG